MGQTTFSGPVVSQNGFIDSSFTNAERDAIVNPQPGLLIYNTDTNTYEVCTAGGAQPTWDSAFSGGGGGGSAFPYVFSNVTLPQTTWGSGSTRYSMPVLFSQNGLQATIVSRSMGMIVNVSTLAIPFDLTSSTGNVSLQEQYIGNWAPIGSFFNADGSQYTFLATDSYGSGTVYYAKYNLAVNFDMTTAMFIGSGTLNESFNFGPGGQVTSASLSTDGTKVIFGGRSGMMITSSFAERTLTSPYQIDTIQVTGTIEDVTSLIQTYGDSNSMLCGLTFSPSGTVAYVSSTYSGIATIFEFNLGTPYNLLSSSQGYRAVLQIPGTMMPTFGSYNWGLTLVGNNQKLVIGYAEMGQSYYTTATLQAVVAPNITGVSPSSGSTGTTLTITGTGFIGTNDVQIGGVSVSSFTVSSNTQITVDAPGGTGTVDIVVTNPAGNSTEVGAFTYTSSGQTTYSQINNYYGGGITFSGGGSGSIITVNRNLWFDPNQANNLISKGPGTAYSVNIDGYGTYTITSIGNWAETPDPGVYSAFGFSSIPPATIPSGTFITSISFNS